MDIEESDDEGIVLDAQAVTVPTPAPVITGAIPATSQASAETSEATAEPEADEAADEAVAAAEAEPEVEEAAGDAAEAADEAGEASPFAEVQPRRTGRPGKKRDRWEPEVRGVVKGKAAKKERKAAAAAAAAASSAAANDDDEGLELMRSASSATGYMGVTYAPKGNPTKPYQAAHGDEHLGFFARPVEAARAIARHARLLEGAAASEFPEVLDAAPPAPPPKPKAVAAKAAAKAKGSSSAPAAVAPNAPPYTAEQVAAARAAIAAAAAEGLQLERSKHTATSFKNVSLREKESKVRPYYAMIGESGRQVGLGRHTTAEEAALAVARHRNAGEASTSPVAAAAEEVDSGDDADAVDEVMVYSSASPPSYPLVVHQGGNGGSGAAAGGLQEPKRFQSAFFVFMNANRDNIKAANPSAPPTEVGKIAGELWKEMDEAARAPHVAAAEADRARYDREVAAARAAGGVVRGRKRRHSGDGGARGPGGGGGGRSAGAEAAEPRLLHLHEWRARTDQGGPPRPACGAPPRTPRWARSPRDVEGDGRGGEGAVHVQGHRGQGALRSRARGPPRGGRRAIAAAIAAKAEAPRRRRRLRDEHQ